MDSGLMKNFNTDNEHFDIYQLPSFESNDLWDHGRETLHMNLTHTLDGILPSSPTSTTASHSVSIGDTVFDCDLDNKSYLTGSQMSTLMMHQNQVNLEDYESNDDDETEFVSRKFSITSTDGELDMEMDCDGMVPSYEIIPIDPDCEYNSPMNDDEDDEDDDGEEEEEENAVSSGEEEGEDEEEEENLTSDDELEQVKESNFSKIEMKMEEYDNDCDIRVDLCELLTDQTRTLGGQENVEPNETNNNHSFTLDDDLDLKNFDLTKYITEDDCKIPVTVPQKKFSGVGTVVKKLAQTPKRGYKRLTREFVDSDSDESIDVETISEASFSAAKAASSDLGDNVIVDPNWSPVKRGPPLVVPIMKPKELKPSVNLRQKVRAILPTPPNQNSPIRRGILNAGPTLSHNKLISTVVKSKQGEKLSQIDHDYCTQKKKLAIVQPRRIIEIEPINPVQDRKKNRMGVGMGKNMANMKLNVEQKDDNFDRISNDVNGVVEKSIEDIPPPVVDDVEMPIVVEAPRRKLNLQEYKMRRENNGSCSSDKPIGASNPVIEKTPTKPQKLVISTEVKSPVPTPKEVKVTSEPNLVEVKSSKSFDPILEATKKALRLKKTKLSEPKIVIPSNSLIPILPLAEITAMKDGDAPKTDYVSDVSCNVDQNYEEIVIVSIGCNTTITLPPNYDASITNKILSTSSLFSNINDTLNKVNSVDQIKVSPNSLLSSITGVVKKNSETMTGVPASQLSPTLGVSPPNSLSPGKPETATVKQSSSIVQTMPDHGEDKIIMHLRKDRVRPKKFNFSVQTAPLPDFMPLNKLERQSKFDRHRRSYRNNYRKSSCSSTDDRYHKRSRTPRRNRDRSYDRSRSPHHHRHGSSYSRRRSRNRSVSRDRSYSRHRRTQSRCSNKSTTASPDRGRGRDRYNREHDRYGRSRDRSRNRRRRNSRSSSSRSSYSSRSRSRCSSSYRSRSNSRLKDRQTSPEERRIVYVGRIEKDTTREDLKGKFISYGPIKQITFHHKEVTGMKYGFVTYENAQDAFKAIDSAGRDPKISMYDISFGGRRAFCRQYYSDLDGSSTMVSSNGGICSQPPSQSSGVGSSSVAEDSFEALLQKMKEKLCAKKPSTQKT